MSNRPSPAVAGRAAEPQRERLRDRDAGERRTADGVGLPCIPGGDIVERLSGERLQKRRIPLDRRHVVARVAAREDLDTGHPQVGVAHDEQVRGSGETDRSIARRRRLEDHAHPFTRCVEQIEPAGDRRRGAADCRRLREMPLRPLDRQRVERRGLLPAEECDMLRVHEPHDRHHHREPAGVRHHAQK